MRHKKLKNGLKVHFNCKLINEYKSSLINRSWNSCHIMRTGSWCWGFRFPYDASCLFKIFR